MVLGYGPQVYDDSCDRFYDQLKLRWFWETQPCSALLRVLNYVLLAVDSVVLVLFDSSAFFDNADHTSLLSQKLCGTKRFSSVLLQDPYFPVRLGNGARLDSRPPQVPLLFSLCLLSLGLIIRRHDTSLHFYVDYTQVYLLIKETTLLQYNLY